MPVSRRHFLFGSLALPALAAKKKPAPVRPNVVLIVVDGLPSWILGSAGNKEVLTPNLDRLAQTGTRFSSHITCAPAPALGRASMMTGRTPMQLGDAATAPAGGGALTQVFGGLGYVTNAGEIAAAVQFLDQQTSGKEFFLTAGFAGLQPPYDGVAQKYRDLYAKTTFDTLDVQKTAAPNARAGKEMLADAIGSLRKYAAAVSALDAEVGTLIAKLSQRQMIDNTLIVFTSTCGSLLGRHGLWDSGEASDPINMYEEAVCTPLFWSWSGRVPAQSVRPELVSTYDLLPSLCDAVGADPPSGNLCGRSYLLLATGKRLPKKQTWRTTVFGHYQNTEMARIERYKLVMRDGGKGPGELYDFQLDPVERVNQYENQQFLTVKTELTGSLAAWKQHYSA